MKKTFRISLLILLFLGITYSYLFYGTLDNEILTLRAIRYLLCIFTGFTLSMNGALLQTVTQNILAEPYLVGISGGALIGYLLGLTLPIKSSFFLSIPAFIFALLGVLFVYTMSTGKQGIRSELIVLSGIFVNLFASSLLFLSAYILNISLDQIIYLLFGSMNIVLSSDELPIFLFVLGLGFILELSLIFFSREFDLIATGSSEAKVTGVNPSRIKTIVLFISSLTTAITVAMAGMVGFVGLVVPHITRELTGKRHIEHLPFLIFSGGIFLLISDFIAKSLFTFELPIGSITALFGIPFFFITLIKKRYEGL